MIELTKKIGILTLLVVLLISVILISGCFEQVLEKPSVKSEIKPEKNPKFMKLYSPDSPFNQIIPPDSEVDPNSDLMVESLKDAYAIDGLYMDLREWTVTVFYADENTPRYDVTLTADWAEKRKMLNVPIPDEARPDPEEDGEMVIIDLSTGY